MSDGEHTQRVEADVERLQAIDVIMKHASLSQGSTSVRNQAGGYVMIYLGTVPEAERLRDLLVGIEAAEAKGGAP